MEKRTATVLPTVTGFATWLAIAALRKSDVLVVAPLLQRAGLRIHDSRTVRVGSPRRRRRSFSKTPRGRWTTAPSLFTLSRRRIPARVDCCFTSHLPRQLDQSADCVGIALKIRMNLGHATFGASAAPVAASGLTELLRWPLSMKKVNENGMLVSLIPLWVLASLGSAQNREHKNNCADPKIIVRETQCACWSLGLEIPTCGPRAPKTRPTSDPSLRPLRPGSLTGSCF
jgi:hypothetical protein